MAHSALLAQGISTRNPSHLAAGFNGHGQLATTTPGAVNMRDWHTFGLVHAFEELECDRAEVRIFYICEKSTVFLASNLIVMRGPQNASQYLEIGLDDMLKDAFGNRETMHGCLDIEGRLYTWSPDAEPSLARHSYHTEEKPQMDQIAEAGNGEICVMYEIEENQSFLIHFETLQAFHSWYENDTNEGLKWQGTTPGQVKQLAANEGVFVCLRADGTLWTWGDPRFYSLGREISEQHPAHVPEKIHTINGKIEKISGGGWMFGALDDSSELWYWGSGVPIENRNIEGRLLPTVLQFVTCTVQPRCFPYRTNDDDEGRPLRCEFENVMNFGIGDNHIIVLDKERYVWVLGDNQNGQLGSGDIWLDHELPVQDVPGVDVPQWFASWYQVGHGFATERVWCGPNCTIFYASEYHRPSEE